MTLFDVAPAEALLKRHAEIDYPFACEFGGASLLVEEGVFCPLLTKTSPFLLNRIDFRPGERVLDVFSGSGAFGVVAALRGSHAVTVDMSPAAVACARANAARNGVQDRLEARHGDLTLDGEGNGLLPGEVFDLVIANPPLLPGRPSDSLTAALFDPELRATVVFLARLPRHLASGGRSYLLTSDVFERFGLSVEGLCEDNGLAANLLSVADHGYERYRVHRLTHAGS